MRKLMMVAAVAAIGAYLAPAGTSPAQDQNAPAKAQAGAVNDQLFAMAAAAAGMAEVSASQLALRNASADDVKKFAQQMVEEHTKANQQLMEPAAQKRIALPRELSIQDQAAGNILGGLRGEEFDREYAKNQLAAHMCAVQLFTAEAERGRDADLKAMASKLLPSLKEHLRMARQLCKDDGSGAGDAAKAANPQ